MLPWLYRLHKTSKWKLVLQGSLGRSTFSYTAHTQHTHTHTHTCVCLFVCVYAQHVCTYVCVVGVLVLTGPWMMVLQWQCGAYIGGRAQLDLCSAWHRWNHLELFHIPCVSSAALYLKLRWTRDAIHRPDRLVYLSPHFIIIWIVAIWPRTVGALWASHSFLERRNCLIPHKWLFSCALFVKQDSLFPVVSERESN